MTDTPPLSTPAVMLPSEEDERGLLRRQLAEATARAERAEEEARRGGLKRVHEGRKAVTISIPLPWERKLSPKFGISDLPLIAALAKLARQGVQHTGLVDFGPPPDGFKGVPAKGSVSTPDLYFEYLIEKYGPAGAAKRVADKMHGRVFRIREHLVLALEMMIYSVLLDRHHGDAAAAQREFRLLDRLPVYDIAIDDETDIESDTNAEVES